VENQDFSYSEFVLSANLECIDRMEIYMTRIHKLGAFLLVGTIALAGKTTMAQAAEGPIAEEPIAGITLSIDELFENSNQAYKEITQYFETNVPSQFDHLAFAKVSNYVNIRSEANENSEILGKLYDNSSATIIEKKDDWYKIQSGSVKGYIKADFLVTGEDAMKVAQSVGNRVVTINTTTLKVREKNSQDSQVLDLVAQGDNFKVLKELDDWVKISLGENQAGYVSKEFVKIDTVYEEAVSIEEEQASIEEEQAANVQDSDSQTSHTQTSNTHDTNKPSYAKPSNKPTPNKSSNNTSATKDPVDNTSSGSNLGSKMVNFALQFNGNPYVWGGTSLTNGTDCSGFTQSVYAHFGISIPRTSRTQATGGRSISVSNLQPGDLLFYAKRGSINHVVLYIGNGKVIGASSPSTGIKISSYNYRTPVKAVRYIN